MVVSPSIELSRQIDLSRTKIKTSYNHGDQGFLNVFFDKMCLTPKLERLTDALAPTLMFEVEPGVNCTVNSLGGKTECSSLGQGVYRNAVTCEAKSYYSEGTISDKNCTWYEFESPEISRANLNMLIPRERAFLVGGRPSAAMVQEQHKCPSKVCMRLPLRYNWNPHLAAVCMCMCLGHTNGIMHSASRPGSHISLFLGVVCQYPVEPHS
jgi:hypothetical protein